LIEAHPPAPGLRLCALDEIADPGAKGFDFREGDAIFAGFVVRKGDQVFGYVDHCPHAGWRLGSLDDRYLNRQGELILCFGHGALFRIEDGAAIAGPCPEGARLEVWPVEVRDGAVVTL
jgi:nitrite reductase/ring-hydroxylating ferredoxin subunit